MGIYADNAAEYRAKGWAPFPVTPGSKIGFPAGVTGYNGTVTDEKIAEWTKTRAEDNIGLRMEGTLGFDLDHYEKKHGEDQYWAISASLEGDELPKTYTMTARGPYSSGSQPSRTHFFRVAKEAQFVTKASQDIEILQYHHRHAIAAPSVHPKTGTEYQWYDPENNPCGIPRVEDLAELTGAWYDFLLKRTARARYTAGTNISMDDVDLQAWTDSLSDGPVTDILREKLGPAAVGYESGRYEVTHAAVWSIGKLSILSSETPGLAALWQEIFDARLSSDSAETPEEQRIEDIIRSIKGSVAKWTAYRNENPLPDAAAMEWARTQSNPNKEQSVPSTPHTQAPVPPLSETGEDPSGQASLLDLPLARWLQNRIQSFVCWSGGYGWLFYEDGYWKAVSEQRITRLVMDELTLLRQVESNATNDPARLASLSQLAKLSKIETVRNAIKPLLEKEATDFDMHADYINTPKGVLHLPTLVTHEHSPKFLFTKITRGSYIAGYKHPDFEEAKKSLPEDSLNWLQWKFGQAITGYPVSDDKVCFLNGGGENGKSVLVTPIMKALGTFASLVPDGVLLSNKGGSHATEMATLLGVRVAIMEELPEARYLDTKKLKEVAGTEQMSGRFLYKDYMTWEPTHALFVTTNYIPQIVETDWAVWRRMSLVRFPYRFRKPEQALEFEYDRVGDPRLRDKMKNGLDGQWDAVFTWMAEGAYGWYNNGKTVPDAGGQIDADTKKWRTDSDTVLAYIQEYLEFDPTGSVVATDLVKHFNHYSKGLGSAAVNSKTMASRFGEHDDIKSAGVKQARPLTKPTDITRPPESFTGYTNEALGERPTIWTGVKYKAAAAPEFSYANGAW